MQPKHELVREWLTRADDDLRVAELALSDASPVYWAAAFHAAQAAEKSLKAFLIHHEVQFERSHSIDYLLDLCAAISPGAEALRERATRLTDYAVEARYPFPRVDPGREDVLEAMTAARDVRMFVRENTNA